MQNLNRNKAKPIFEKYVAMIENGLSGDSGTEFLTVRELSNNEGVSLVTAQKVFSLLEDYGVIKCFNKKYYLSFRRINDNCDLSRVLLKRSSLFSKEMIGILVPDIKSPFFAALVENISFWTIKNGFFPLVMSYQSDEAVEKEMLNLMVSMGIKGILACPKSNKSVKELYSKCVLPVVFISKKVSNNEENYSSVDNYNAAKQVANHFVDMGYEYYLYIGTEPYCDEDMRYKGFYDQLGAMGISVSERSKTFFLTDYFKELPYHILQYIATAKKPLGIFCYHDIVAEQVLLACKSNNLSIPSDVGIVGFDNLPIATQVEPSLSTVAYSFEGMAETAVNNIINRINRIENDSGNSIKPINHMLIIRNSSWRKK